MAVYEGTKVSPESLVDYLNSTLSNKPSRKPECPNHAYPLSFEGFERTADELIEPFSEVAEAYYAEHG